MVGVKKNGVASRICGASTESHGRTIGSVRSTMEDTTWIPHAIPHHFLHCSSSSAPPPPPLPPPSCSSSSSSCRSFFVRRGWRFQRRSKKGEKGGHLFEDELQLLGEFVSPLSLPPPFSLSLLWSSVSFEVLGSYARRHRRARLKNRNPWIEIRGSTDI